MSAEHYFESDERTRRVLELLDRAEEYTGRAKRALLEADNLLREREPFELTDDPPRGRPARSWHVWHDFDAFLPKLREAATRPSGGPGNVHEKEE